MSDRGAEGVEDLGDGGATPAPAAHRRCGAGELPHPPGIISPPPCGFRAARESGRAGGGQGAGPAPPPTPQKKPPLPLAVAARRVTRAVQGRGGGGARPRRQPKDPKLFAKTK